MIALSALTGYAKDKPVQFAIAVSIVGFAVYYLAGSTIKAAANVVAGAVSGNNAVTQNQTNFAGEDVDAYEGKGVLGTVGAVFNSASGGVFASVGETVGGWAFDLFGPTVK